MTSSTLIKRPMLATKLAIPVVAVASIVSAALGAGAVAGVARDKLDVTVQKTEKLDATREEHSLRLQAIELRLGSVEKNQERQNAALERIESKLGTAR